MYIYIYVYICIYIIHSLPNFKKEVFYSLKIKHKVKWMVKFVKTTSPSSHAHSLLSTTKHWGKIKLHMVFRLKSFFE